MKRKKNIKFVSAFFMLLLFLLLMTPAKVGAATNISLSKLPPFPQNGQKCWVIFKEGFRNSRIELSTCDIISGVDNSWIEWRSELNLKGASAYGRYNQYYLNDSGQWEQIGTYHRFSNYATAVLASNLDVKDSYGRIIVSKSYRKGYPIASPAQCKLSYYANGGTGAPSQQKFNPEKRVKLSSKKPKRNGYSFLGWSEHSNATAPSYYSGKYYNFNKNIYLYAVWKKKIYPSVNSNNLNILKRNVKKGAVSFANEFSKKARNSKGSTAPSAVTQLKKLKNQLSITGYSEDIPDEVVEAFATAVLNSIEESNIDEYETNLNKMTNQIYNQIKSGLKSGTEKITLGKGSKKTVYTVSYQIFAQSFGGASAQVSYAKVKWKDGRNGLYSAHIVSNSSDENMKKALSSYCAVLAQLNKGLWKDFMVKYITDGWKLAGLNSVKVLDDKTVSKYFERSENMVLAICGDKKAKKALISDATGTLKEQLSKMSQSKFRDFIKKSVPNGDKLIKAADQYKKVKSKYNDYINKYKKWKKTKSDNDLTKCEKAFQDTQDTLELLNEMLE